MRKGKTSLILSRAAATTVLVSNSLAFSINITNFTGITLANLVVTDSLPASVNITSDQP